MCVEAPARLAGAGVEREEPPAVRADEDEPVPDRRRRVDVAAGRVRPAAGAPSRRRTRTPCRRSTRCTRGRTRPPASSRTGPCRTGAAAPTPRQTIVPAAREAVHVAVVRADEETAARVRERALDRAVRDVPVPDDVAVVRVEGPDVAVPVADVQPVADEQRRALRRADRVPPVDLPEADAERDHLAVDAVPAVLRVARRPVEERLVDRAVRVRADRRRRGDAAVRAVLPRVLPGLLADRGERARVRREEETAVADRRRELDEAAGLVAPDRPERRRAGRAAPSVSGRRRSRTSATAPAAAAGRARPASVTYSIVGRAADVRALLQAMDDVGRERAGDEHGRCGEGDEQAPHARAA